MSEYSVKHPILFEVIVTVLAFMGAAVFAIAGSILSLSSDFSTSVGRIIVGIVLLVVFRKVIRSGSIAANLVIVLPALLFVLWNIFYNLSSGASFGGSSFLIEGLLTALAPAIFEEVLFRGIFIGNLQKSGKNDQQCLLISAVFFALVHLSNAVGADMASVLLQVAYSLVIGMVLSAIYLKNQSIWQVILVHFLIDFFNRIYINTPASSSALQIVIFVILLLGEALYALWLLKADAGNE